MTLDDHQITESDAANPAGVAAEEGERPASSPCGAPPSDAWPGRVLQYASEADWRAARVTFLGASDAYCIVDGGRYAPEGKGPMSVWEAKRYGEPEFIDDARVRRGKRHEGSVMAILPNEYGIAAKVVDCAIVRHPAHEFLACSPDGVAHYLGQPAGVETKTISPRMIRQVPEAPYGEVALAHEVEIPEDPTIWLRWLVQCTYCLAVTGAARWLLSVDSWDEDPRVFVVERDEDECNEVVRTAFAFWHDHVLTGVPPEVSEHDSSAWPVLARRYTRTAPKSVVDLTDDHAADYAGYELAKAARKEADAAASFHRARIKRALAEHTHGRLPDGRLAYFDGNGSLRARKG